MSEAEQTSGIPVAGASGGATVASITANVAGQYTGDAPKRKRGRPPGSKTRPKDGGVPMAADPAPSETLDPAPPNVSIDKELVGKTVKSILGTVDTALVRRVYRTARAVGIDEGQGKEIALECSLPAPEQEQIGELVGIVMEKHGLLSGYAPELLLGIHLSGWGVRVGLALRRLEAIGRENAAAKRKDVSTSQGA